MARRSFWVWVVVGIVCSAIMWAVPGSETVPYHIAWATFALCFGLEVWSAAATWTSLAIFTVVTGSILVLRVAEGVLDWQEAAEIPLMLLLMALMVVHVRRRQGAIAALTALHERESREAHSRELLTRRTSHEMRSPLTITRGYIEVLEDRHVGTESAIELAIVSDELKRLTRVCERLVRSLLAQQDLELEAVDLDDLLLRTRNAWAAVAEREWLVTASAGTSSCSPERLRACLDTLVENAIRYTRPGDTIELFGSRGLDGWISVGVSDSGPGFSAGTRRAVLAGAHTQAVGAVGAGGDVNGFAAEGPDSPVAQLGSPDAFGDELSQTGLGLGMVEEAASRRGGRLEIGVSQWGGARVGFSWPARTA
ncbi:sensor histidine kinase [Intrasporangium flavum]|uniref:sensor histidine kinase n=1 Tax=Intrasporangium flavum TaxID=1428657 RepID=UPI001A96E927|nr:HAMP domain-containing sensor histidine kinase [Intrasporangium flavum]